MTELLMFGAGIEIIIIGVFLMIGVFIGEHITNKSVSNNVETDNKRISSVDNINNVYDNHNNSMSVSDMAGIHREDNIGRNMGCVGCYEHGEITNLCAIIALKNIKREMQTMLTPVEIDALNKAVDNTIIVEKLKAFIDNVELEDIDIDE